MKRMKQIVKHGLIIIKEKKILINRKRGTTLFLLPGGKPETGETPEQCLVREIEEEHGCKVVPESISFFGEFSDAAANEPDTIVVIKAYLGKIVGEPQAKAEIEECKWFGRNDDVCILSPVLRNKVLPRLIEQRVI